MGFRMKHKFSIILEFWFGQFICSIRNSVLNLSQIYSMLPLYVQYLSQINSVLPLYVLITNLQCAEAIGTYHKFTVCCRYMYLSQIYSVLTLYVLITNLQCADAICSYYKFTVCWRYMYFSQIYSAQPLYALITNLQCALWQGVIWWSPSRGGGISNIRCLGSIFVALQRWYRLFTDKMIKN